MSSAAPLDKRTLAYSILEFLDREANNESSTGDSRELLEVAIRNIETVFNVDLANEELRASQPLDQIYQDFVTENSGNENSAGPDSDLIIYTGEVYVVPEVVNEENQRLAESHSNSANINMIDGQFWKALENYTLAINLDGRNAVYFCNRAASYLHLKNLAEALRDCQVAIQLNPKYARAYEYMGKAYSAMKDHARAHSSYSKAAQLEPTNETYAKNILTPKTENAGTSTSTCQRCPTHTYESFSFLGWKLWERHD